MRSRETLSLAALMVALAAAPVFGMATPPPPPPPSSGPSSVPGSSGAGSGPMTPRQEAEQSYGLAYEEVGKAARDLEAGKAKNAEKKYRRALERCRRAVALDERYHEAWNLIGYTSRKLNDYDAAFQAYEKCLAINPEYAPALEYLGEAWLEKGDVKKSRAQLGRLELLGAPEAAGLRVKIDAYLAAHPEARTETAPAAASAAADSASGSN